MPRIFENGVNSWPQSPKVGGQDRERLRQYPGGTLPQSKTCYRRGLSLRALVVKNDSKI